ncbi:MAG: hypothetical protein HOI33_01930 [Rhodospirillaceae bacterium]|jgi:hypothetical protein|nr:hypothetical protein [Rhodospirillaceae bacterium]MBT5659755.1 hypothetical protein [Rhodospirillaceae bacterium]MBT5751445.1 hypothetical protein [Rhodospirillaceae bacterium]
MMISPREITLGLYGAFRLALLDVRGMAYFNCTEAGFWRSFTAAAIAAPGFIALTILHLLHPQGMEMLEIAGSFRVLSIETIAYVIGWVAFPLAIFYISAVLDRQKEFIRFIIAYNWSGVIQIIVLVPIVTLNAYEVFPQSFGALLSMVVTMALFYYQWFIAKTALKITAAPAAMVVCIDVALSILITGTANALLYGATAAVPAT